ncbi:glycine zipper 2TM domain-containing protein [Tsuneonella sp. HG222]
MNTIFRTTALALAAGGLAAPAVAADFDRSGASPYVDVQYDRGKHKGWHKGRGNQDRYYDQRSYGGGYYQPRTYYQPRQQYYAEPVYRDTRVWRGNDGQYYCRKRDGTTGLIVGAAAGALLGRSVDRYGDRTLGTVLGAAAGALLGKEVASGGSGCR